MGTNYYHERELCDKCHNSEREHIGKSSAGWTFTFHATETIRSFADWKARLSEGGRIVDEYGDEISLPDFVQMVENKRKPWGPKQVPPLNHTIEGRKHQWGDRNFLDPEGHSFSEGEFS
jgi:hypothetical protein